jgi:hypothetical protein
MKFALITEGVSEFNIIKHIIVKYFKDQDPYINPIQPIILNDKQETTGGWVEVLKYCEREEKLKNLMLYNDYLVIQIDTDQSQNAPFNINHLKPTGEEKTTNELLHDVLNKLNSLISPDIKATYSDKIFFAISIHTLECWLLPLFYVNNHKSDTKGCLSTLNSELVKKSIKPISTKNSPSAQQSYRSILINWKKKSEIIASAQFNIGFKGFLESLDLIKVP